MCQNHIIHCTGTTLEPLRGRLFFKMRVSCATHSPVDDVRRHPCACLPWRRGLLVFEFASASTWRQSWCTWRARAFISGRPPFSWLAKVSKRGRKRFRVWSIGRNFQMRCCRLCDCVCYMLVHGSHNALRFICHHTFWSLLNSRHLCPLLCAIQCIKNQGPPPTKTFACLLLHSHDPFIEFPQGLVRPTKNAFAWSRVKPPLGSVQIGAQDACTWGFQLVPKSL